MTTPTSPKVKRDIQDLSNDSGKISFFNIDLTGIGGGVFHITPGTAGGPPVSFAGNTYISLPVTIEGMKWEGNGKMPRPTMEISNITLAMLAEVVALQDLVGGKVERIQTYEKYLDGMAGADTTAHFPKDVYFINRKIAQSKQLLKFELKSPVDLENLTIPRRKVLKTCRLRYRVWNGTAFDYSNATCPYTDTDYYDETGAATTAENDACGRGLYDCKLRFPSTNNTDDQLPGSFFPGVGQFGSPYRS
ncbi:MAG TPA: phage minor tail protein L [Desulfobacteraceae bacterium]|mgnify:CR=1 FL=1|nr:phage minor tail protein L [Desulfobacteraceae bacterium]